MSKKIEDGLTKNQRWYRKKGFLLNTARVREWRQLNKEATNASTREYYARNVERLRAGALARYRKNRKPKHGTPDVRLAERLKKSKRAALRRNSPATLTAAEWREICTRFENRCAYCGSSPAVLEQDHVLALSRGGSHTAENVVPACKSCNSSKGARFAQPRLKR